MAKKISKKLRRPGWQRKALAIAAAALLGAACGLGGWLLLSMGAADPPADAGEAAAATASEADDGFPKVNWGKWLERNPDVVGWVTIPGTNVNHPIVQAKKSDPEFYLHHDVYGNWNPAGVPFADASCDGLLSNPVTPIYGHHYNHDRIFAQLADMTGAGFSSEHPYALLQTPEHKVKLEAVYADRINAASEGIPLSFSGYASFKKSEGGKRESATRKLAKLGDAQQVWKLTTCSYSLFANERTVVAYKAVEVDGYPVAGGETPWFAWPADE